MLRGQRYLLNHARLFECNLQITAFILLLKSLQQSASRYVSRQTRRLWNCFATPELDICLLRDSEKQFRLSVRVYM